MTRAAVQGMGLLYATSNKGASHMAGDVAYTEVFGVPVKERPAGDRGQGGAGEAVARRVCHYRFGRIVRFPGRPLPFRT